MHSLAKKLMMARKLRFGEDGKAELLDHDFFFVDGFLLKSMLEKSGENGSMDMGIDIGKKITGDMKRTGLAGTKLLNFMFDLLTMTGLGKFSMEKFDLKTKEGEVRVMNSLPGRELLKSGKKNKTCHFNAGIISGIFATEYSKSFQCKEIACIAEGSDMCRFKITVE